MRSSRRSRRGGATSRRRALLKVSRSAYYDWSAHLPTPRRHADDALAERIQAIHKTSRGTYGWPRVHQALRRDGVAVSGKWVARSCASTIWSAAAGGGGPRPPSPIPTRPRSTWSSGPSPRAPSRSTACDVGDVTYITTWKGGCPWPPSSTWRLRRADHGPQRAPTRAGAGLSLRPRQPQYASAEYRRLCDEHGITQSLSRPRQCWDNARGRKLPRTLKTELTPPPVGHQGADAPSGVRLRRGLLQPTAVALLAGYLGPAEYEAPKTQPHLTAQAA